MLFQYNKKYYVKRENDRRHFLTAVIINELCSRRGLAVSSFLDVGCASGCLLATSKILWNEARLVGIGHGEIPRSRFMLSEDPLAKFIDVDLDFVNAKTVQNNAELSRKFDIISSIEVVEHVDPKNEKGLVEMFAQSANGIVVISAARAGQRGYGHINCMNNDHWIDLFTDAGLKFDQEATKDCRDMMKVFKIGAPENMMVFSI